MTRIVLAQVIVVALAILPYQAIDSDSEAMLARMRDDLTEARERLASVKGENDRLRAEIEQLRRDPRAIEERARRDLGMVRPDETMIVVKGAAPNGKGH